MSKYTQMCLYHVIERIYFIVAMFDYKFSSLIISPDTCNPLYLVDLFNSVKGKKYKTFSKLL